jgi:phosphoglycerol transferase
MGKKKRSKPALAGGSGAVATEIRQVSSARPQGYSVAQTSKPNFFTGSVFEWLAIAATSLLAFWFLTVRIVGVQVSVLADEYLYLIDAHYNGLSEAKYPNYLFQWIYSSTKLCGTEFYSCARSINALFVALGAIFIYLLAKHIGRSKWLGALAAVVAILGSYGTYTAYFMPEAIFNGLMMVFFWALIRFGKSDNLLVWASIGTSLGVASLAKPHGLFVIPAIVIFVILWTRATKDRWLVAAALRSVVFVGSVVGSKFLFGYLLAGERALSLFGMYGSIEAVAERTANVIVIAADPEAGTSVFFTAWGQVLMITMILGLALPAAIHGLVLSLKKDAVLAEQVRFRALMGLLLLSLMPAIAIFEAWQNLGVWMHTRYYTYLLPLAVVALIEGLRQQDLRLWPWAKYAIAGVFIGLAGFNLVTAAEPFASNWIDAPDFTVLIGNLALSSFAIVITIIAALIWPWFSRTAIGIALLVSFSLSVFTGQSNTEFLKATFGQEMGYEHIARVLRDFIPQDEVNRTVMYGQYEVLQRTVFSAMAGGVEIRSQSEAGLDVKDVDSSKAWLVTVGNAKVSGFGEPTIIGGGYNMYSLDPANSLMPRNQRVAFFSNECLDQSDLGWACGAETEVSLNGGFSPNANVDLVIELSQEASEFEIELVLGDSSVYGGLSPGLNALSVQFSNSEGQEVLSIRVRGPETTQLGTQSRFVRVLWGLGGQ